MNDPIPSAQLRIASPCSARWSEMSGDERARFCSHCSKHVYNLSAMSAAEARALVREKEGKLCVRYFLRGDGTILTQDCPEGLAKVRAQWLKIAAAFAGVAALFGFGAGCEPKGHPLSGEVAVQPAIPPETGRVNAVMGDIADPRPSTNTNTNAAPMMGEPAALMGAPAPEHQAIMGKVKAD
ncbi:MAG: hypothetical protein JO317_01995 [Verrucomicrobiae bacterium]|nr:hypothetical protein [Verrucomicrobiae bacterium]